MALQIYVNQRVGAVSSGSQTSVTTGSITSTSGNLLVAIITAFGNNIGATPLSDSKSNTWTAAISSTGTSTGWGAMFYVENCTGGSSHTFTFTASASDFLTIEVIEVVGAALSSSLGSTSTSTALGSTHDSGSISAGSTKPEIFIGGGPVSATAEGIPRIAVTSLWGTAQALAATASTEGYCAGYRIVPENTSDSFIYTASAGNNATVMIAGFKAASAGGGAFSGAFVG